MGGKSLTCLNLTSSDFRPIGEQEVMALSSAVKTHDELVCRISSMEPMMEWYGVVVCVSEVKQDNMGQYLVFNTAYDIPYDSEALMQRMFDLSLTHKIVSVLEDIGWIYVMESKDGTTNIDSEVMAALEKKVCGKAKTLMEELSNVEVEL